MSFNKIIFGANHPSIDPTNVTSHIRRCNAPSLLWWATIPGYWLLEKYAVTLPASWLHWWQKILLNLNLRAENYVIDLFEVKLILFWRDFVPLGLTSIIVPILRTILAIISSFCCQGPFKAKRNVEWDKNFFVTLFLSSCLDTWYL